MAKKACTYLEGCPMFKLFSMESSKAYYIAMYCKNRFEKCQRKQIRDKNEDVPDNLLPDGAHL